MSELRGPAANLSPVELARMSQAEGATPKERRRSWQDQEAEREALMRSTDLPAQRAAVIDEALEMLPMAESIRMVAAFLNHVQREFVRIDKTRTLERLRTTRAAPDTLPGLIREAEAMRGDGMMPSQVVDAVQRFKDDVGDALLDERLEGPRGVIDGLVSASGAAEALEKEEARRKRVTMERRALMDAVGNQELSSRFAEDMVARGEWEDVSWLGVLLRSTGAKKAKLQRDYSDFLDREAARAAGVPESDAEASEALEALGRQVIDAALQQTGVTPREAAHKAAQLTRTGKGARGVATRAGWKAKDYERDMVELMRLAGKTIPAGSAVVVGSDQEVMAESGMRLKRAKGRSYMIEGRSEHVGRSDKAFIALSGMVDKRTLFHEFGHAIDAVNPLANAMVARWLKRRTEGYEVESLRSLTGVRTYGAGERAVKDHFIDPYVGKVYPKSNAVEANEALSMGLERLADPMTAAQLAIKDPDHLALILAALQLEYQP